MVCHFSRKSATKGSKKNRMLPGSKICSLKKRRLDFPGGAVVKNPPDNAGDTGSIHGLGRSHMPQGN